MFRKLIFLSLFWGFSLQAKSPSPAPVLPPKDSSLSPSSLDAQTQKKISRAELMGIGFEVATLGVRNSSSNDLLGLQLLYGLRAVFIYPLSPKFFLKPSVGYFLKPEREGEVSVTQNVMEAGLGIHYALLTRKSFLWHVGLSQRADYLFSKISIKDSSANTPGLFRYRAGAASGLRFKLGSRADLTFDLEVGAIPFDNFRLQSAFSSGIIFFID